MVSELTHEDVQKILQIIDGMDGREVCLEIGELKLHVSPRDGAVAPLVAIPPAAAAPPPVPAPATMPAVSGAGPEVPAGQFAVRAPTMGTFYRASSPGAKPFVEIGDHVNADDTVCTFEVMKLFSSLKAGVDGTIAAIAVANESMVEQDQILVIIAPTV